MEAILVTSVTNHRLDVMIAKWFCVALTELGIPYVNDIYGTYDKAIVFNGVLNDISQNKLDIIVDRASIVFYMVDDCDLELPTDGVIVSQFKGKGELYFNIASLAIMDIKWNNPTNNNKMIHTIYGGTFKERRDYSIIPNKLDTIIVGDDCRWDKMFTNTVRLPTIRDMQLWYKLLSISDFTYIVSDIYHNNINIPLRLFECVFTNTTCIIYTGEIITPLITKKRYTKKHLLKEVKCLIQQM